ncbi:hypothetical protein [Serratia sp. S4]|uniref:hypothetical protein n=1 Tax=Serratia TaxID=613 RepID=UPI00036049CD|nr:hypothetical protein [Serratia sp. S4]
MRLSAVQKDVIFVLFDLVERKGITGAVSAMRLLSMINYGRCQLVADTNFRRSCHTLVQHGFLEKYRDRQSLKLAFRLSPMGKENAAIHYASRLEKLKSNKIDEQEGN